MKTTGVAISNFSKEEAFSNLAEKISCENDHENKKTLKRDNENALGSYLAGSIEGDGSIVVPATLRNEKGKLLYPVIKIIFVNKDAPLALKLQLVLGGGTISYSNKLTYLALAIQDVKTIHYIASIINGKMRTPKIEALHRLISWLNNREDQI